jgi:hypothetical protein
VQSHLQDEVKDSELALVLERAEYRKMEGFLEGEGFLEALLKQQAFEKARKCGALEQMEVEVRELRRNRSPWLG